MHTLLRGTWRRLTTAAIAALLAYGETAIDGRGAVGQEARE